MTPEMATELRKPFAKTQVGKLPKVWCHLCRDKNKQCGEHKKQKCRQCKANITTAHNHVDFVGHADVTDRLLKVDPDWNWEPATFDSFGSPYVDENGGLWIRLTVGGTTRLGYGHADGKKGGDAVKEAIGDAIRNAAMRFGVALDLWRKETAVVEDEVPSREVERPVQTQEERKTELRGQIAAVGKRKSRTIEQIADDFTAWSGSQQLQIQSAPESALIEYLDHMQREVA